MVRFVFQMVETTIGKSKKLLVFHFLSFFHNVSRSTLLQGRSNSKLCGKGLVIPIDQALNGLILTKPFTKLVVFAVTIDQDQPLQNVQTDLISTLSAMLKQYRQKIGRNLQSSSSYCRIKI